MLEKSHAYSGFAVRDLAAAKDFYTQLLGLSVDQTPMGLTLHLAGGLDVFVYQKPDHQPATYTILNFPVEDVEATVDYLANKGVVFEQYNGMPSAQDEKGILRGKAAGMGPDIAWFKDLDGNIFSIHSL